MIITTVQLHLANSEFRFCAGSNPHRCVSEICDGQNLGQWSRVEIRCKQLSSVNYNTKQFIINGLIVFKLTRDFNHSAKYILNRLILTLYTRHLLISKNMINFTKTFFITKGLSSEKIILLTFSDVVVIPGENKSVAGKNISD